MMRLSYILRKCTKGFKLTKSKEKTNHVMNADNIKLFEKKGKRTGDFDTNNKNV